MEATFRFRANRGKEPRSPFSSQNYRRRSSQKPSIGEKNSRRKRNNFSSRRRGNCAHDNQRNAVGPRLHGRIIAQTGRKPWIILAKKKTIDLVLLDMTMPTMGGKEVFQKIRRIKSHAKVIISSGYSDLVLGEDAFAKKVDGFSTETVSDRRPLKKDPRSVGQKPQIVIAHNSFLEK